MQFMEFFDFDKADQAELAPYFRAQKLHMGDFSVGFMFMWHDALKPRPSMAGKCLVIREYYARNHYFHYPLSLTGSLEEEMEAVEGLETYCRENYIRLHFTNVPENRVAHLVTRYGACQVTNNRRWRDYLYRAEDFREYPGKRYAGQRNHVHKFEKLYPDRAFTEYRPEDEERVRAFLHEYEEIQRAKHNFIAEEEMDEVYAILPHIPSLGLLAGILTVEGKIVGFSVGERCGDMIVVHIEKALRDYEGAYPFLAQQFARTFCRDGVEFLNRMDDAGDLGLRKSKLQYHPCEVVGKYNVIPKRAIELVSKLPKIETERLTLMPVREEDAEAYARLATDKERNRFWGEAWGMPKDKRQRSAQYYVKLAQKSFQKKCEMPLGIYADGVLVGEVLLHTFGYAAEAEIGVRLLPEYEGQGYAAESVRAYARYGFSKLNLERVEAKCYRANEKSRAMLLRAGMHPAGEDEEYYRFEMTASM